MCEGLREGGVSWSLTKGATLVYTGDVVRICPAVYCTGSSVRVTGRVDG
jgi:hypothetical protein